MPPLISEDLDEHSSIETGTVTPSGEEPMATASVDGSSLPVSRQSPKLVANKQNAPIDSQKTSVDSGQPVLHVPVFEDDDLGEQLQRSAQEGLSDLDADAPIDPENGAGLAR